MISAKIISSLEKVYVDSAFDSFAPLQRISVLKGERLNFQIIYSYDTTDGPVLSDPIRIAPVISGELTRLASLRAVHHVPVIKATHPGGVDDNYSRTSSGLYPDILRPMYYGGKFTFAPSVTSSAWVEINIPKDMSAGSTALHLSFAVMSTAAAGARLK